MSGNLSGFDASTVETTSSFEPLPAGKYRAIITKSEMKPTKGGNGKYLELQFELLGDSSGKHKGRRLWDRLNLINSNQTAVTIAKESLAAICKAVGIMTPNDSAELHNKPLLVRVAVKKSDYSGDFENVIKGFEAIQNGQHQPVQAAQSADSTSWVDSAFNGPPTVDESSSPF